MIAVVLEKLPLCEGDAGVSRRTSPSAVLTTDAAPFSVRPVVELKSLKLTVSADAVEPQTARPSANIAMIGFRVFVDGFMRDACSLSVERLKDLSCPSGQQFICHRRYPANSESIAAKISIAY